MNIGNIIKASLKRNRLFTRTMSLLLVVSVISSFPFISEMSSFAEEGLPLQSASLLDFESSSCISKISYWDGTVDLSYADGSGTESDPYIIENGAQLALMSKQVNSGINNYAYFKLNANIYLNRVTNFDSWDTEPPANEWTPIGHGTIDYFYGNNTKTAFCGHFDGNGHTIAGLYINRPEDTGIGLFGVVSGFETQMEISNLNLAYSYVVGKDAVGGIIGYCDNNLNIYNCQYCGKVKGNYMTGGIAGRSLTYGTISYCQNYGDISGEDSTGGIIGMASNCNFNILKCMNSGVVSTNNSAGGICGNFANEANEYCYITDCYNTGDVIWKGCRGGGILGSYCFRTSLNRCYNVGNVIQSGTESTSKEYGGIISGYTYMIGEKDCFYLDTSCSQDGIRAEAKTAEQLKNKDTFKNYDFDTVWSIGDDRNYPYPKLIFPEPGDKKPEPSVKKVDSYEAFCDGMPKMDPAMAEAFVKFICSADNIGQDCGDVKNEKIYKLITGDVSSYDGDLTKLKADMIAMCVYIRSLVSKKLSYAQDSSEYAARGLYELIDSKYPNDISEPGDLGIVSEYKTKVSKLVEDGIYDFLNGIQKAFFHVEITKEVKETIETALTAYDSVPNAVDTAEKYIYAISGAVYGIEFYYSKALTNVYNYFNTYIAYKDSGIRDLVLDSLVDCYRLDSSEASVLCSWMGVPDWEEAIPFVEYWAEYFVRFEEYSNTLLDMSDKIIPHHVNEQYTPGISYTLTVDIPDFAEIRYSIGTHDYNLTELPSFSSAEVCSVYYCVYAENYAPVYDNALVNINKSNATISVDKKELSVCVGEKFQIPAAHSEFGTPYLDQDIDVIETKGEYTVSWVLDDTINYYGTKESITIRVNDHVYSDWETIEPPTEAKEGKRSRVCSNCGNIDTESIPRLKSTPVDNTKKSQRFSCGSVNIEVPQFSNVDGNALIGTVSYTYNGETITYAKLNEKLNKIVDIENVKVGYMFTPENENYKSATGEISIDLTDSLKLLRSSILTNNGMGVAICIRIPEVLASGNKALLKYSVGGREEKVIAVSNIEKAENDYMFTCSTAPAELSDVINVKFVCGDYESEVYSGSVASNAMTILGSSSDGKTMHLVKSMINFGAQAQFFFDHNADNPANSFLDENDRELTVISAMDLIPYRYTTLDNDKNIDFVGQSITLRDKVSIKFYFSGDITADICTVNNAKISADDIGTDENGTYVAVHGITPDDYDKEFTINIGGVTVKNASVFSYLYTALKNERTDLYGLVYSMYEYNKAVEAFAA